MLFELRNNAFNYFFTAQKLLQALITLLLSFSNLSRPPAFFIAVHVVYTAYAKVKWKLYNYELSVANTFLECKLCGKSQKGRQLCFRVVCPFCEYCY
jgi:hypothetical protein